MQSVQESSRIGRRDYPMDKGILCQMKIIISGYLGPVRTLDTAARSGLNA